MAEFDLNTAEFDQPHQDGGTTFDLNSEHFDTQDNNPNYISRLRADQQGRIDAVRNAPDAVNGLISSARLGLSLATDPMTEAMKSGFDALPFSDEMKQAAGYVAHGVGQLPTIDPNVKLNHLGAELDSNPTLKNALGYVGDAATLAVPEQAASLVGGTARAVGKIPSVVKAGAKALVPDKALASTLRSEAKAASQQAFDETAYLGDTFTPQEISDPVVKHIATLEPKALKGFHTEEGSALSKDLEHFKIIAGQPMTLDEIRIMDRQLTDKIDNHVNKLNGEVEGNHGRSLVSLQDALREAADSVPDKPGVNSLNNARAGWSAQRTLGDIERVFLRAKMTQNEATAMQNGMKQLRMKYRGNDKKIMALMENAAETHLSDDAVGAVGSRLLPIGNLAMGNISGAAITAATGMAARSAKAAMTVRRINKLAEYIAKKGMPENISPLSAEPKMALRLTDQRVPLRERALARKARADAETRALGPNQRAYAPEGQKLLPPIAKMTPTSKLNNKGKFLRPDKTKGN